MAKPDIRGVTLSLLLGGCTLAAQADLVVLQYHHVSDSTPPATSTSVSLFEGQLDMIKELDLQVVGLEPGTQEALEGRLDDEKRVAITFDDAYESVHTTAAPLLEEKGYPYTIFVNTDAVGKHGYMTWEQLQEAASKTGVTIANHSKDHGHLVQRPDESESAWRERASTSLDQAQSVLQERLGVNVPMFAYPYGEYDQQLEDLVSERGWLGYGQHSGAIGEASGSTRLPRFPMANAYGQLNNLKEKLRSKALPVEANKLPDPVVDKNPPTLNFLLPDELSANRLSCFASGQGRIDIRQPSANTIVVQAPNAFSSRRFRYNCTHPAPDGSYYWLSQQWLDLDRPED